MRLGRWFWTALVAVLYVCAAALRAAPASRAAWLALALGPLALLVGWQQTAAPAKGADRIEPRARAASRGAVVGFALVLVTELAPSGDGFLLARATGVGLASVASLVALVRVSSLGGIAARTARARYDAAVFAGAVWGLAVVVVGGRVLGRLQLSDPLAAEYAMVAASLASLAITMVASFRLFAARRFELGVAERAAAALWLTVLCLFLGVFAVLLGVAEAEHIVPETAVAAALAVASSSVSQRPSRISRALRTAVAVTMLCAPLVSVAVVVAYKWPTHAGLILFVATISAAGLGLVSSRVARRLAPERGLWLRVLERALVAAKEPEPQQATSSVLAAIRDGLGADVGPAALHRLASADRVVVDRAGYTHTEPSEVPPRLIEIADGEPERVLSTEALRYIQVERPDVRPILAWLDGRGAGAAALVVDDEVCVGVLLWPAAGRVSPLSFEEVTQLRRLANHLGSATGALAQLARSRAREMAAEHAMTRAEDRVAALEENLAREGARQRLLIEYLAAALDAASYSPAMQSALVAVEKLSTAGEPFAMVAPGGVDVLGWVARAHLASSRRDGPLVVVDATRTEEQPIERWSEQEPSPFDAARGGTLVIVDAQALDRDTQRYVASAHPADVSLIVTLAAPLSKSDLDAHFVDHMSKGEMSLPKLADRAEDLRALALFVLVRIGYGLRGKPMGLSLQAQELLNEHDWPGNETELRGTLLRAAHRTVGDVIETDELAGAIGAGELTKSGPQPRTGSS